LGGEGCLPLELYVLDQPLLELISLDPFALLFEDVLVVFFVVFVQGGVGFD
jgi:hypothetical protein